MFGSSATGKLAGLGLPGGAAAVAARTAAYVRGELLVLPPVTPAAWGPDPADIGVSGGVGDLAITALISD